MCNDLCECQQCSRRLSQHLFTEQDSICDTCVRKNLHPSIRTAVDGVVEEHEIPTLESDIDLHGFMDVHENEILRILEQAINQHR